MADVQHPTAFCKSHGFFPATLIGIGPGAGGTFIDCKTSCPACGQMSEVVPGTYHAHADRINLLVDRSISPEALAALRRIAEQAKANQITPEEAKEKAEKIAPGAGRLFDVGNWSDQAKATLYASIIGAIAVIGAAKLAGSTTNVTVAPTTERVIERPVYLRQSVRTPTLEEWLKMRRSELPQEDQSKKSRKHR